MNRGELEHLSRDELIDLVLHLQTTLEALQHEVETLRRSNEQQETPPPPTSQNSSQPPSQDQKANRPANTPRKKHGPPTGHPKYERQIVSHPDEIVEVRPTHCPTCQIDLAGQLGCVLDWTQITELPEPQAQVIEVRQVAVTCPDCGVSHTEEPPPGLELQRQFGARLEATIVYYRHEQHMSYERTQAALLNLHGVTISQGGIDQVMQRASKAAAAQLPALLGELRASAVINSDETSVRVTGQTWWHWVFCAVTVVVHVIRKTRGFAVITEVLGETPQVEVWGSDCLAAQLKTPAAAHQLCLAHQLRDLQRVIDGDGPAWWARAMRALFQAAIHLYHQRATVSPDEYATRVARLERLLTWLLARSPPTAAAMTLCQRYRKHRDSLLVFLHRTDVEPTNNVSERAVRPSVIHTKVSGGFRSEWGANAYAAVCSVIDTARQRGTTAFAAVQALMGTPALPLPLPDPGE
jgi:transposase